ncbi:MAG: hypothetical protein M1829_005390 [Trizodia sp. TS-e1964]|nr:MAG: hypothetical protein M1829_005390 [Trizodia sp. TS-e1964]
MPPSPRVLLRRLLPLRRLYTTTPSSSPPADPSSSTSASATDALILAKYRSKLEAKAAEKGLPSAAALRADFRAHMARLRSAASRKEEDVRARAQAQPRKAEHTTPPTPPAPPAPHAPGALALSALLSPDELGLPVDRIEAAWRARVGAAPRSLCACVPGATYARMARRAKRWGAFVLPLPAEISSSSSSAAAAGPEEAASPAASMHFVQWRFAAPRVTLVLVTHLAEYKLRGEFAAPHTVLAMHLDLLDSRGVVLLEGGVGGGVGVVEGQWFASVLARVWGGEEGEGGEAEQLLDAFSRGDEAFSLGRLVRLVGGV